jgi:hypothetical protein
MLWAILDSAGREVKTAGGRGEEAVMGSRLLTEGLATALVALAVAQPAAAQTNPKCDPLDPVADAGWSVVPSLEALDTADGAPFQEGASGNWFVTRTTKLLPFCNYYNDIGIYSLRSYTLQPQERQEKIAICKAAPTGGSVAVPPYAGSCPPR